MAYQKMKDHAHTTENPGCACRDVDATLEIIPEDQQGQFMRIYPQPAPSSRPFGYPRFREEMDIEIPSIQKHRNEEYPAPHTPKATPKSTSGKTIEPRGAINKQEVPTRKPQLVVIVSSLATRARQAVHYSVPSPKPLEISWPIPVVASQTDLQATPKIRQAEKLPSSKSKSVPVSHAPKPDPPALSRSNAIRRAHRSERTIGPGHNSANAHSAVMRNEELVAGRRDCVLGHHPGGEADEYYLPEAPPDRTKQLKKHKRLPHPDPFIANSRHPAQPPVQAYGKLSITNSDNKTQPKPKETPIQRRRIYEPEPRKVNHQRGFRDLKHELHKSNPERCDSAAEMSDDVSNPCLSSTSSSMTLRSTDFKTPPRSKTKELTTEQYNNWMKTHGYDFERYDEEFERESATLAAAATKSTPTQPWPTSQRHDSKISSTTSTPPSTTHPTPPPSIPRYPSPFTLLRSTRNPARLNGTYTDSRAQVDRILEGMRVERIAGELRKVQAFGHWKDDDECREGEIDGEGDEEEEEDDVILAKAYAALDANRRRGRR